MLPSTRQRRQERRTSVVDGVASPHHRNLVAYFLSTEVAKDIAGIVVVTGALLVYGLLQVRGVGLRARATLAVLLAPVAVRTFRAGSRPVTVRSCFRRIA